jgi:hypothetical protein
MTRTHSTYEQVVSVESPCRRPSRPSSETSTLMQSGDRQHDMPHRAGWIPGRGDTLSVTFGTGDRLLFRGDGVEGASCGCLLLLLLLTSLEEREEAAGAREKETGWGLQRVCCHRTARRMTLALVLPS